METRSDTPGDARHSGIAVDADPARACSRSSRHHRSLHRWVADGALETPRADRPRSVRPRRGLFEKREHAARRRKSASLNVPVVDLELSGPRRISRLLRLYRFIHDARPAIVHAWLFHAVFATPPHRPDDRRPHRDFRAAKHQSGEPSSRKVESLDSRARRPRDRRLGSGAEDRDRPDRRERAEGDRGPQRGRGPPPPKIVRVRAVRISEPLRLPVGITRHRDRGTPPPVEGNRRLPPRRGDRVAAAPGSALHHRR